MRRGFLLFLLALIAACGGGGSADFPSDAFSIAASGDLGVGTERLLVGVAHPDGTRLGGPDAPVTFEVSPLDQVDDSIRVPASFVWILEPVVGLYRADVEFDHPGPWQVTVIPENGEPLPPTAFNVFEETFAPRVGEPAPLPPTPTIDDLPIEALTTDANPDLSFYETSLPDAVASGQPTVLVFSTPAYCQTSSCGPLLELVKEAAPEHPDVNFIHVEVFTGLTDPDFAPDGAHLAPAVLPEWYNLPSEPWVFIIDGDGIIRDRFEGVMAPGDVGAALSKISL